MYPSSEKYYRKWKFVVYSSYIGACSTFCTLCVCNLIQNRFKNSTALPNYLYLGCTQIRTVRFLTTPAWRLPVTLSGILMTIVALRNGRGCCKNISQKSSMNEQSNWRNVKSRNIPPVCDQGWSRSCCAYGVVSRTNQNVIVRVVGNRCLADRAVGAA